MAAQYVNTWGRYPWSRVYGIDLIHPDERQRATQDSFLGKVFHCTGETQDGYLILAFADERYRVRPDIYLPVSTPTFRFGDLVRDRQDAERVGTIRAIFWHTKHGREFYNLLIKGRAAGKRYFSEELELIAAADQG